MFRTRIKFADTAPTPASLTSQDDSILCIPCTQIQVGLYHAVGLNRSLKLRPINKTNKWKKQQINKKMNWRRDCTFSHPFTYLWVIPWCCLLHKGECSCYSDHRVLSAQLPDEHWHSLALIWISRNFQLLDVQGTAGKIITQEHIDWNIKLKLHGSNVRDSLCCSHGSHTTN